MVKNEMGSGACLPLQYPLMLFKDTCDIKPGEDSVKDALMGSESCNACPDTSQQWPGGGIRSASAAATGLAEGCLVYCDGCNTCSQENGVLLCTDLNCLTK